MAGPKEASGTPDLLPGFAERQDYSGISGPGLTRPAPRARKDAVCKPIPMKRNVRGKIIAGYPLKKEDLVGSKAKFMVAGAQLKKLEATMAHYNTECLCVRCKHLKPALDANIQKAYLGKCVKREWPFTLSITLQGWTECEVFEASGKHVCPTRTGCRQGRGCGREVDCCQAGGVLLQLHQETRPDFSLRHQAGPRIGKPAASCGHDVQGD